MSKLTKEKINELKEEFQCGQVTASSDFQYLAESVADDSYLGDKDWVLKLYYKAEELAEESHEYRSLAESVANDSYLGDKKWAIKLYKKAEELGEHYLDYQSLAESVADDSYLGDKDWVLKLYYKAEELAEEKSDYQSLAESVANDSYLGDKDWAVKLYKKAVQLVADNDDYGNLANRIESEYPYLFPMDYHPLFEKMLKEIRNKMTNSDEVIVAKNFDNGTSQSQGNEVCIGGLNQDQISEIAGLLKKGTYLESDYFQSFFNYDELYHGNGILICETDDIYNASDKDNYSKGNWKFLEGEEDISDVIVKNDLYLVTCRVETVYFYAQLPAESKDIPPKETIELTAILDRINPMEDIPWDYFWEECPEIPWLLFKGVKCKYGEFERDPMWEEGAGYIYNTYQMIFHKNELLVFISNRSSSSVQFPFQETEDYCPYLVNENELDQDKLNKSIQKLEEVTT
jgi:hypothetical protein